MSSDSTLRFIAIPKPGQSYDPEDAWALRSHVRKAVCREKSSRPISHNLKFVDQTNRQRRRRPRKKPGNKPDLKHGSDTAIWSRKSLPSVQDKHNDPPTRKKPITIVLPAQKASNPDKLLSASGLTKDRGTALSISPTLLHPFVAIFAKHVRLHSSRLDFLFKSEAFRMAAEPCFDTCHIDSSMGMQRVFPDCTSEPVFLNALAYAMVQVYDRGRTTVESLHLKGKTVALLNKKLASTIPHIDHAIVGAIMVLKSMAYKYADHDAHHVHSQGLSMSLRACQANKVSLTEAAKRAVFWMDLFSNILLSSPRQVSVQVLPQSVVWSRSMSLSHENSPRLPVGFSRHHHLLPDELIECVLDICELQSCLTTCPPNHADKHPQLDTMQACIESRLALQAKNCRGFGIVTEATRLGLFITCYQMWTETWESALVPSRVAAQLIEILEADLCPSRTRSSPGAVPNITREHQRTDWSDSRDLQLWLLLLGASTAELDRGHVDGLRTRYSRTLRAIRETVMEDPNSVYLPLPRDPLQTDASASEFYALKHWKNTFDAALTDFVYWNGCRQSRFCIPGWLDLETSSQDQVKLMSAFLALGCEQSLSNGKQSAEEDSYNHCIATKSALGTRWPRN